MAIETVCSGCGKTLKVGDEHAGKRARCPSCGQIYTVGFPQGAQASDHPGYAETSPGSNSTAPAAVDPYAGGQGAAAGDEFWMKAPDGNEYGPVDRETLNRWYSEGRVGSNYMIKQGAAGVWAPSSNFSPGAPMGGTNSPTAAASTGSPLGGGQANPYSAAPMGGTVQARTYSKPDQGTLILVMGILSWVICPVFGIVAWVMGSSALKDIENGLVNPASKGVTQAGYYIGMVHIILTAVMIGFFAVIMAIGLIAGA